MIVEPPLQFRAPSTCLHPNREVDTELPLVTCADCGATLDPYWCLRDMVLYEKHLDERVAAIAAATKEINQRITMHNSGIRGVVGRR